MLKSLGMITKEEPLIIYGDSNNALDSAKKPGIAQAVTIIL